MSQRARQLRDKNRDERRQEMSPAAAGCLLWPRAVLAGAMVLFVVLTLNFIFLMLRVDVKSKHGLRIFMAQPEALGAALGELEAAHKMAPYEPVTQFRFGNLLLQQESLKSQAGQSDKVRVGNVQLALNLLDESRSGFHRPQIASMRVAHAAGLMMGFATDQHDNAQFQRFATIVWTRLNEYREIQGQPEMPAVDFYGQAMLATSNTREYARGLDFMEDYLHYYGRDAIDNHLTRIREITARQAMGEFPFAIEEARILALDDPDEETLPAIFDWMMKVPHEPRAVWRILEELELQGRLPEKFREQLTGLRKVFAAK